MKDDNKEVKRHNTQQELTEDNIFPHGLSEKEKQEVDKELLILRKKNWHKRSKEERLRDSSLQQKYQRDN